MKITQEQLESLQHYQRMFVQHRDELTQLCKEERPDINIGFELGRMSKYCGDFAMQMDILINEIDNNG